MDRIRSSFWQVVVVAIIQISALASLSAGTGSIDPDTGELDFVINFRYVPTAADITRVKDEVRQAADRICDATEGQVRFGDVRLTGGAASEDEADIWILPQDGRSAVSFYSNGSNLGSTGRHINLFQGGISDTVIAHELGHHAFGLGDQYDEQRRWGGACGIGRGFENGTADAQNHSIMQQNDDQSEFSVAGNHDPIRGDGVLCPPAVAASNLVIEATLDSGAAITAFDDTDFSTAEATSAASRSTEVIDGDGAANEHELWAYFEHSAAQAWTLHLGIDDGDIGGTEGDLAIIGTVDLTFDPTNGSLASISPAVPELDIIDLTNGAADMTLAIVVGTIGDTDGVRETGASSITRMVTDGFPLCEADDCSMRWNSGSQRWESTQQSLIHNFDSDWEAMVDNYDFLTAPADLPVAAAPANCRALLNFVDEVEGSDQVMLFIDRSGSMDAKVNPDADTTRSDFAKAAARAYVDLQAGRGVSVGMVSFEETPTLHRGLDELMAADAQPLKDDEIDTLMADGYTGIGTALNAAIFEFQRVEAAGRVRTAFLLSDGENNRGEDPEAAADRLQDEGVRIFTIPVGSAADRELLSDIAGESGGTMLDAASGDELPSIFFELFARVRGESMVLSRTETAVSGIRKRPSGSDDVMVEGDSGSSSPSFGSPALPQRQSLDFYVEGGAEHLNVLLSARNTQIATWAPVYRLTSPTGTEFISNDPSITLRDQFYIIMKVPNPEGGNWTMDIMSTNTSDQHSFAMVHLENPAPDLYADARPVIASGADPVTVSVVASYVADLGEGVEYTGSVRRPDGSTAPLKFSKDHLTGVVSASFSDFLGRGIYSVSASANVSAQATLIPGEIIFEGPEDPGIDIEAFNRSATASFFLDVDDLPPCTHTDCDGDGIPNVVEGNLDTDGDGLPDSRDDDADGDDVPDEQEGIRDSDGDGVPGFQDTDSDNDGIPDGEDETRATDPRDENCLCDRDFYLLLGIFIVALLLLFIVWRCCLIARRSTLG